MWRCSASVLRPSRRTSPPLVWPAKEEGFDTLLVDTAGRLQIDTEMMEEMVRIRTAVQPDEVLLVVDSMIGQEAAELTRAFHEPGGHHRSGAHQARW